LAEHQQATVRELEAKSEAEVAIAIQQCFRHVFYPANIRPGAGAGAVALAHTALDTHSASERPGAGQLQVVRQLRDARKLRTVEDEPDAPAYVRDRTPLRRGQISTAGLRDEFRRDAALPMLVGDDIFVRGIRLGVERGEFVYRKHDLVYGKGDPHTPISVEEEAVVFTMAYAVEHKIWPRPEKQRPPDSPVQPVDPSAQPPSYPPAPETRTGPVMEPGSQTSPGDTLRAEGVLREALNRIFEQAVARKVALLAQMSIRVFETADGFRLLGVMGAIRSAETRLELSAEFETPQGSEV
jgi:hypothetical protein